MFIIILTAEDGVVLLVVEVLVVHLVEVVVQVELDVGVLGRGDVIRRQ